MIDTDCPLRVGILLNPLSGRVRRNPTTLRALAEKIPGAMVVEASTPQQMLGAIGSFGLAATDLLVVVGGDGTLQAALTALLQTQPEVIPRVYAIAAGTTNMSAADLGTKSQPDIALAALHGWLSGAHAAPPAPPRAVVEVADSNLEHSQFGLFFGAGAIISGVRYFHETVSPKGVRGIIGPSLAFIRVLLSMFGNRTHRLLPPTKAKIDTQMGQVSSEWLVILATTLNNLLMGSKPYWGHETAPMHFTAITHGAPRLLLTLPSLLRGKHKTTAANSQSYFSNNLACTTIADLPEYLLDGEIYKVHGQLELRTATTVRFVVL